MKDKMKQQYKSLLVTSLSLSLLISACSPLIQNAAAVPTVPSALTVPAGAGTGVGGQGLGPAPVNLGLAGTFAILAQTAISVVPGASITGNIGISPAAASYITGFSINAPPTSSATASQVVGLVYAADYDPPTPSNMTTSIGDMGIAFTDAAGRAPDHIELGTGSIGGMNLPAAVYKWSTDVVITSDLYLSGGPNDVWIFEIAGNLQLSAAKRIILSGGAKAKNIFWQVSGSADMGLSSHFEGILMSQTAINLQTHASANGRLLAQTAVTLDQNDIVQPY